MRKYQRDLVKLYNVDTKETNEAKSRNKKILEKEYDYLKLQIVTSKGCAKKGNIAFSEQDVVMIVIIFRFKIFMSSYMDGNIKRRILLIVINNEI